jgi:hypothetical protein
MDTTSQTVSQDAAPIGVAVIPPGTSSEQRIAQLKADPGFNQRLISGDKAAEAEMLALMRHASRHPAVTAAPRSAMPPPAQSTAPAAVVDAAGARARIAELKRDEGWVARYMKGGSSSPGGIELDRLTRLAVGMQPLENTPEPSPTERALAGLGAPPRPADYKVDVRDPVSGFPLKMDEQTSVLVKDTLLPTAHALDLSQSDVNLIVMGVEHPMDYARCEASLARMYGKDIDAALDDFRAAVGTNAKVRELLEQYPETLGNNPAVISSIVAAYRRRGAR